MRSFASRILHVPISRRMYVGLSLIVIAFSACGLPSSAGLAQSQNPAIRVHTPYWDWETDNRYPSHSIFWFGQVGTETNYVDIRTIYYDEHLEIVTHIIDRNLYQSEPAPGVDLTEWDALSIWLNTTGAIGDAPTADSFQFTIELGQSGASEYHQHAFHGDSGVWSLSPIDFSVTTSWRGTDGPNTGKDAKGWSATITIPFESLDLTGPPELDTTWGFALALHDRDSYEQAATSTLWPESMINDAPESWAALVFGRPDPQLLDATDTSETMIRHGLDGITVRDAHVGGHTDCGESVDHWSEWGNTNYAAYAQINIQNQWDVSDYPCFSKYFITFPLDSLPDDIELVSAELTLFLFGNAGYEAGQSQPSAIQALTVAEDWDESTITWNNAPLATDNIALTWVEAVDFFNPGIPYTWNVSAATAEAYETGQPIRLALHSADGEYHSGKYFWSSDADDAVRPHLLVKWREADITDPPDDVDVVHSVFMPVIID